MAIGERDDSGVDDATPDARQKDAQKSFETDYTQKHGELSMNPRTHSSSDQEKLRVQAWCTEYQALMNRIIFFMSMQWAPWVAFVAFLGFILKDSGFEKASNTWCAVWALQFCFIIYSVALHEVYHQLRYIEAILKPRLALPLNLDRASFWAWESYVRQTGKPNPPAINDLAPTLISLAALCGASYWRFQATGGKFRGWDIAGALVAIALLANVIVLGKKVFGAQRALAAAAASAPQAS